MIFSQVIKTISLILLLLLNFHGLRAQTVAWGDLAQGEYQVGFNSFWAKDYSRSVIFEGDTLIRPLLINVWYPVKKDRNEALIAHGDYFDIESKKEGLDNISRKYIDYNLSVLAYELIGKEKHEFTAQENKYFNDFLAEKTLAQKDVRPASGRFPLVIYHQGYGASFEDNSILAQFLARNGYVVIGSSFFNANAEGLGIDGKGESVKDIAYLINYAAQLPHVDVSNIALMGHSGGAQASILAKCESQNAIKAVIAIETTQEIFGLSDSRWNNFTQPALVKQMHMDGALLGFTEHKAVFQLYDLMSRANRYYVTFPATLNHNEYISQGITANFLKRKLEDRSPEQLAAYNEDLSNYFKVNNYILNFLDWKLKNKPSSQASFLERNNSFPINYNNTIINHVPVGKLGIEPYVFKPNRSLSPRHLWQMVRSAQADSVVYYLDYFYDRDTDNPIYHELFAFALISELIEEKNIDIANRLYTFYKEKDIPVTKRFISLSNFSVMMRKKDYAKRCLTNLLKIDPDNNEAKTILNNLND